MFTYIDACMETFITQCFMSIQKSQCNDQTVPKSVEKIIGFVKTSREAVLRFLAACERPVNGTKQH